jgi:hypothetical protein
MSAAQQQSIIDQIREINEQPARITGRCLYGRELEEMDAEQLASILEIAEREARERAIIDQVPPGTCFHCFRPTGSAAIEHVWCREGMTPREYDRAHRFSF